MTSRTTEIGPGGPRATGPRALLHADAVRDRAERLMALAQADRLADWTVDLGRLEPTADFVAWVVRDRYPDLDVPVHSRWRHFSSGGHDLWQALATVADWQDEEAQARAAFDLVITSVLLDAGAGTEWRYRDAATGITAARSEGLALASFRWFEHGGMSVDSGAPLRVDSAALHRIDRPALERALQVGVGNSLVGLDGRAGLLNRLGAQLEARTDLFGLADSPRPGGLFDALRARAPHGKLPAALILETVLDAFGPIWQDRPVLDGVPLGDCWPHPALTANRPEDGYVPLHKLSQWLTYSLIEPLERAGLSVTALDGLTGLAEYRNGGLFMDLGVLTLRDPAASTQRHGVAEPLIVGWRALTVALLDRLAPLVGERLGLAPHDFPLAKLLEGGTWAAGRRVAFAQRAAGDPPLHVSSDGTVF